MKNSTKLLFALILLISTLIGVLSLPFTVYAAAESIESTSVYSDLQKMTQVDLSLYKKDTSDDKGAKIMSFLEYAYDANGNQSDYGLYLYVYNPTCEPIQTKSIFNTVQLSSLNNNGGTAQTNKYRLRFLSVSSAADGADLENLYYKFKIDVEDGFLDKANLNPEMRCYQITDLELEYKDEMNPRSSRIQNTYICTGFQAYHGKTHTSSSTLNCYSESLETIEIEIHPATWKTDTSDKGENYQYEVASVYFNIPNHYLEKYGNMSDDSFRGLEQIHAEWYEYKINGLVTDDSNLYSAAVSALGKNYNFNSYLSSSSGSLVGYTYQYYDKSIPLSFEGDYKNFNYFRKYGAASYIFPDINDPSVGSVCYNSLHNVFRYSGSYFKSISTEDLLKSVFGQDEFYSYSYVDDGKKYGRNDVVISVNDSSLNNQIGAYYDTHGKIKTWFKGLGSDKNGYSDIMPVKMITSDDFSLNFFKDAQAQAKALYVSESDLDNIKNFYTEMTKNNQTVYLMRFAVRDYYFEKVDVKDPKSSYSGDNYFFEKTVFQNFDILDFTFRNERDELVVVPVSSRPINVVGSITPTLNNGPSIFDKLNDAKNTFDDFASWLKLIIFALGIIIIIAIGAAAFKIFSPLFNAIWKISDRAFERKTRRRDYQYKDDENRRAWNRDRRENDSNDRAWNKDRRDEDDNDRAWNKDDRERDANDRAWKDDRRKDDENDRAWRKERRDKEANDRARNKERREDARVNLLKRADKRAEKEEKRRQERHDHWKDHKY